MLNVTKYPNWWYVIDVYPAYAVLSEKYTFKQLRNNNLVQFLRDCAYVLSYAYLVILKTMYRYMATAWRLSPYIAMMDGLLEIGEGRMLAQKKMTK